MKANLEWIEREWRKWTESETGKRTIPYGYKVKEHPEHVAKLFAAFCLEQLHTEIVTSEEFMEGDCILESGHPEPSPKE